MEDEEGKEDGEDRGERRGVVEAEWNLYITLTLGRNFPFWSKYSSTIAELSLGSPWLSTSIIIPSSRNHNALIYYQRLT